MKEHLERLVTELQRYGIKPSLVRTGSGHVRVSWQAEGRARDMIVSSTISDHRGTLNNVAMIRRWCREDQLAPIAERVPLSAKVRETPGKINLTPVFKAIEKLQSQIEELFNYITTPEAVTEEPKPVSGRVPSTDLLQHLSLTEWTPAARLAIKAARPYANVQSALKQLELKGLAVNYKGVGWKRTPPEAVQVKVKPRVIVASPPVQPAAQVEASTAWLGYFDYIRWTTGKAFAARAKLEREQARSVLRQLEQGGWLEHNEKHGWRRHYKRQQPTDARQSWGGRTYGVASDNLLPLLTDKYQPNSALAAAWGRTLTQTMDALKQLQKQGLVENKRYVGWRLSSSTQLKTNGRHHQHQQEQHH